MSDTASTDGSAAASATFCPAERRKYVLIAAILASSMGFIDGSVVSIAIPALRADLGAALAEAQWISNSYMLFLASLLLLGGAVGDRFGLRRVFMAGIGMFTLASVLCALMPAAMPLILARGLQGIGAAFMIPASLAIIAKAYPRAERGRAIGIWAGASALMTALGPVLGGGALSLLGDWSWRLIFAINLPLGAVALALLWFRVPPDDTAQGRKLDVVGAVLATLGLGLVAFGLTGTGGEGSVPDLSRALWLCGAGLLILTGFCLWETRTDHPMMPLRLFASKAFAGANLLTFTLYFALSAVLFFLPMSVVAGWGIEEAQLALGFLPLSVALALMSGPSGEMADRFGPAPLILTGSLLVAVAYAGLAIFMPEQDFWGRVVPMMVVMAIGMGLVVSPLSTAVMTSVEDADTGTASGVNNAVSRIAGLIAVAAMGGVAALAFSQGISDAGLAADGLSFGVAPEDADPDVLEAWLAANNAGFIAVAWVTAALAALSGLVAAFTLRWGPAAGDA